MESFEVSVWNPYANIRMFVPERKGNSEVHSFLAIYCCIRLNEQFEYNCRGHVDTPGNVKLYYPWLLPDGFCFLGRRMLMAESFDINLIKNTLDDFLSKITVGDSMHELILKCNIICPHIYWLEETKPVLYEHQPVVSFSYKILSVVEGCAFEQGTSLIELSKFTSDTPDDFDLYVLAEMDFGNQDTEIVSFTITTPKRIANRFRTYFSSSQEKVKLSYGHLLTSEYSYTSINNAINEFFTTIQGNNKAEVLLRVASCMDILNLDLHLGTVLTHSDSVYTIQEGGVNFNYR